MVIFAAGLVGMRKFGRRSVIVKDVYPLSFSGGLWTHSSVV